MPLPSLVEKRGVSEHYAGRKKGREGVALE